METRADIGDRKGKGNSLFAALFEWKIFMAAISPPLSEALQESCRVSDTNTTTNINVIQEKEKKKRKEEKTVEMFLHAVIGSNRTQLFQG